MLRLIRLGALALLAVAAVAVQACGTGHSREPAWVRGWASAVDPEFEVESGQSAEASAHGLPVEIERKADGQRMVLIPSGTFLMGRDVREPPSATPIVSGPTPGPLAGAPQHEVRLTRPYYMDVQEVSIRQWNHFCEGTGREDWKLTVEAWRNVPPEHDELPATKLPWSRARAYCEWAGCDHPTQAQWERAARGGIEGAELGPDVPGGVDPMPRNRSMPYPVESTPRNPYALRGMCTNAKEWCLDRFGWYEPGAQIDPRGSKDGFFGRVVRGGSRVVGMRGCDREDQTRTRDGLRCVRVVPPAE